MQDLKNSSWFVCKVITGSPGSSVQPPAQTRLLRALSSWILKTCRDGDCTASLGNLSHCLTVLMAESFSSYPGWASPFSFCLLSLHQYHCIKGVRPWDNTQTCPKVLLISASRACPGRRQGPGHAQCFLLLPAGTALSILDQQPSHWAALRGTHFSTWVWCLESKRPRNQTLQHLHFFSPLCSF